MEVEALGKELPDQAVLVFDAGLLPWRMRAAKVKWNLPAVLHFLKAGELLPSIARHRFQRQGSPIKQKVKPPHYLRRAPSAEQHQTAVTALTVAD